MFTILSDRDKYKESAIKYYKKCERLERFVHELERKFSLSYIHGSTNIQSNHSLSSDDIIKDALRIAIKYSHPDNGGTSEDFIRFKEALDNMK